MNKNLSKIFPAFNSSNGANKFNVIVFPEGFRQEDKKIFNNKCRQFIKNLDFFFPLNSVFKCESNINIYTYFIPSEQYGILHQSDNMKSNTFLNSYIDIETKEIHIDPDRLLTELNIINSSYSDLFERLNTLIVILTPPLIEPSNCIEEKQFDITFLGNQRPTIVSVSSDGWEYPVVRTLGSIIGLGDEFGHNSHNDEDLLHFGEGIWIDYYYPNLLYLESPKQELNVEKIKWKPLMSKNNDIFEIYEPEIITNQSLHKVLYKYSAEKIGLWEGGGGHQTNVFRSAHDCIMRRKIGDPRYPIRDRGISFCPVCEYVIRNSINQGIWNRRSFFSFASTEAE